LKSIVERLRRLPKWALIVLLLPVLCITLVMVYLKSPHYLEIGPLNFEGARYATYVQRSVVEMPANSEEPYSEYHLWRREGSCEVATCGSWEDIVERYDKWLTEKGWEQETTYNYLCDFVIPEWQLAKIKKGGFMSYLPVGSHFSVTDFPPRVCLVILPSLDPEYWNIIVGTANAAPITIVEAYLD
jgi:hypothetical protein